MRGALSHVEQHAFGHWQDSECTFDIVVFFPHRILLTDQRKDLSQSLGCCFCLVFSSCFNFRVFFQYIHPFSLYLIP